MKHQVAEQLPFCSCVHRKHCLLSLLPLCKVVETVLVFPVVRAGRTGSEHPITYLQPSIVARPRCMWPSLNGTAAAAAWHPGIINNGTAAWPSPTMTDRHGRAAVLAIVYGRRWLA